MARLPGKNSPVNIIAKISDWNAAKCAAFEDWKTRQGSGMIWPKADEWALLAAAVVVAMMLCAYALPESEATIYLRTTAAVWGNLALIAVAAFAAVGIMAPAVGRALGEAAAEAVAGYKAQRATITAGDPVSKIDDSELEDWTYVGKMSPLLSPTDKLRISQTTNPRLNEDTAAKIKSCLAASFTTAETARETGLSLDTVKKYAALIRKGFDNAALSVEL